MYWTKIRLVGLNNVDLPIVGVQPTDTFILKSADGLGPPAVDVSIANTIRSGGVFQMRRPQLRQVVLRVGLNPNSGVGQTASDLRNILYGLLTPGFKYPPDSVQLQIMNGETVVAQVDSYVSNLEIAPFSKDPEVQITLDCTQPYLYGPSTLSYPVASMDKAAPSFTNPGNAPTGFLLKLKFTAVPPQTNGVDLFAIYEQNNTSKMEFRYKFAVGDLLSIDTRTGYRNLLVTHTATTGYTDVMMPYLSSDSRWLHSNGGRNEFHTTFQGFTWDSLFILPTYWGI